MWAGFEETKELELGVLGALMMDPNLVPQVLSLVDERCFLIYGDTFRAIKKLSEDGRVADMVSVATVMSNTAGRGRDGRRDLAHLGDALAKADRISVFQHALFLVELRMDRDMKEMAQMILKNEDGLDVLALADKVAGSVFQITNVSGGQQIQRLDEIVDASVRELIDKAETTGMVSGFDKFDEATGGFEGGELVVIAGRPSMGKSAFSQQIAEQCAMSMVDGEGVLEMSFEMKASQLAQRTVYRESGIGKRKIRRQGPIDMQTVDESILRIKEYGGRVYINDPTEATIGNVISLITVAVRQYGVKLVVIDYLQLLNGMSLLPGGGSREREIASMTRALKQLALQLDIPILLLSQLGRKVEDRPDKKPRLSDLRESGAIEQDADTVAMLWQPQKYGIDFLEDGTPTAGRCWILFTKQRHGATCEVVMMFDGATMTFSEVDLDILDAVNADSEELPF